MRDDVSRHNSVCGEDPNAPYRCPYCGYHSDPRRFVNPNVCPQCHRPRVDKEQEEDFGYSEPEEETPEEKQRRLALEEVRRMQNRYR